MAEWWEGEKPVRGKDENVYDYGRRVRTGNVARRKAGLTPWVRSSEWKENGPAVTTGNGKLDHEPIEPAPGGTDQAPNDTDWGDLIGEEQQGKPPAAARTMVRGVSSQVVLMLRTVLQAVAWMIPNHLQHLRPLVLLDPLEEQMVGNLVQSYVMGLPAKARAKAVFAFNRMVPPVGLLIIGGQIVLRRWQILRLVIASQPNGRPIVTPPPAGPARQTPAPSQVVSDPEATTEQAAPASDLMEAIG